jgi:ketosteroid isomerase-like protein
VAAGASVVGAGAAGAASGAGACPQAASSATISAIPVIRIFIPCPCLICAASRIGGRVILTSGALGCVRSFPSSPGAWTHAPYTTRHDLLQCPAAGIAGNCPRCRRREARTAAPDTALPAPLDRVLRDYEQAWRTGDARALAALFAEDGFVLQSNQPPVRGRSDRGRVCRPGRQPVAAACVGVSGGGQHGLHHRCVRYGNNGDTGKFTLTLKRVGDGPWLIFSDMDNTSAPPRAR